MQEARTIQDRTSNLLLPQIQAKNERSRWTSKIVDSIEESLANSETLDKSRQEQKHPSQLDHHSNIKREFQDFST